MRFGCFPRCLIELARKCNHDISIDDFCARFEIHFIDPDEKYGALDPAHVPEIANALSIPSAVDASPPIQKLVSESDYDRVIRIHKQNIPILIGSRIDLNEGSEEEAGHCSILEEIDADFFTLWTPVRDGQSLILPPFPRDAWLSKQCYAMILV